MKKNDIIQVTEKGPKDWIGCLMQVEDVKSFGVLAYIHVPNQGDAYLRLNSDQFEVVGKAVLVHPEEEE